MGSVCCKQGAHPHEHTVTSIYQSKSSAGDFLCEEIKSQFRLCPTRRRQKLKQRRRFKKKNWRKERPSISSPQLLNPKYLTGEKWQNVILTIPDPKMKTRTPVPPPRKKRKSLINLCTRRNESVEYMNLDSCGDLHCDQQIFDDSRISETNLHSSEPELFKQFIESRRSQKKQKTSNLRRSVSYEDVASLSSFHIVIKTSSDNTGVHVLNSYINRCLLCYINDIMSLVKQVNKTNNEETELLKLDDNSGDENDGDTEKEVMREFGNETEEQEQDGTIETKLCEINEQKLLESLENFCIHCYLNKIQTHPKEREDISSTSTKVKENNLKSFQTGDNNNFSLANKNVCHKITLMGNTYDKKEFPTSSTLLDESALANTEQSHCFTKPHHSRLDKKYECLFCCINKKKTKQKHYNNGSLCEIYSKKQRNNVFKSDNINEQECKYTIGNKIGDKRENKIRNEKLCEINNAHKKNIHDSNNMLQHFKNLNSCRKRHLNLFKYMCFQCFYIYVQILYILQSSALFNDDFTSSIFKMRKCEIMRDLNIKDIRAVVNLVQQIHSCYVNNSKDSNICKSCTHVLKSRPEKQDPGQCLEKGRYNNLHSNEFDSFLWRSERKSSEIASTERQSQSKESERLHENHFPREEVQSAGEREVRVSHKVLKQDMCDIDKREVIICDKENIDTRENKTSAVQSSNLERSGSSVYSFSEKTGPKKLDQTTHSTNKKKNKILQKFENATDNSVAERRKIKFEKLMADLNSKKISTEERSQLIVKEDSAEVSCDSADRDKGETIERKEPVFDANGNYLSMEDATKPSERGVECTIDHLSKTSNGAFIKGQNVSTRQGTVYNVSEPETINKKDDDSSSKYFHIKRNSIKRKSYRFKRPPENINSEQIPGELTSRRSSVTDSLYELEASLYEMLQNSCYLSMDDIEYV